MKRYQAFLAIIFVIVLTFNIAYAFKTPEFSNSNAYHELREVEHITKTGLPLYQDPLSYSGRERAFMPLFDYVLALFSILIPISFVAKIIPAIFSSSIVIIVYLITHKISNNRSVALLSSFMSGFIPVYTSLTLNTVSIYSFILPLLFLSLYFYLRMDEEKKYAIYFAISFLIAALAHPISFLLLLALLTHIVITKIEGMEISSTESEVILFSTFFILWAHFLIYKNVLLNLGPSIIWQNIPSLIRAEYFSDFNILIGIVAIGLIPFLFGIYVVYAFFFRYRKKTHFLYISIVLSTLVILWLRLIELEVGLSVLAIVLVLLFSHFYKNFLIYLEKTKLSKHSSKIFIVVILIFIITSVVPCFLQANANVTKAFDQNEIKAMEWIKENTNENSIVLGSAYEGHFISFKSGRKNVADTDFLSIKNPSEILLDISTIYTSRFETEAIPLLTKYGVNYIVLTERIKDNFGISNIEYIHDNKCFDLVYKDNVEIYKAKCKLEVSKLEV